MANWFCTDNRLGVLNLGNVDNVNVDNTTTNNRYPIGTVVRGTDSTLGGGEFIYLQGGTSVAIGTIVSYNATTGAVTAVPNTGNLGVPVAISLAANTTATNYSWYQIGGLATVLKLVGTPVLPQAKVYISSTAGTVAPTSASGKQVLGAKFANLTTLTSAATTGTVMIDRPSMQSQIT